MINGNTVFWTVAAAAATSWFAFEILRRKPATRPGVEEIGESDEQLQQVHHPLVQEALDAQRRPVEQAAQPHEHAEGDPRDMGAEWDQDDRARLALEERQAREAQDTQRVNAWKQKGVVGTKKAKSLERRDRRRAYYEYVRQEAERERQRIQTEEEMFGDLVAEEREERQKRIEQARVELEESNRKRREREEEERSRRNQRRREIKAATESQGYASLSNDEDIEIADELSNVLVLESGDFAVTLTPQVIESLAATLKTKGRLDFEEIQQKLPSLY